MKLRPTAYKLSMLGLSLLLLVGYASADIVHLENGQIIRGKLGRVTGDIIGFQRDNGHFSFFRPEESIQRLRLSNRHDVVETRNHEKLYGEILYVDKFRIELLTTAGTASIPRINVKNIVLGSPSIPPDSHFSNLPSATLSQPGDSLNSASTPMPQTGGQDEHDNIPSN